MYRNNGPIINAVIFITLFVFGSFVIQSCEPPDEPLVIGATMSETGDYSTQGIAARNGYLLCAEHLNEDGGLLGQDVEFLIYDDLSDPATATGLYEQLIIDDEVDAVMGPYGSTLTEAVAPITEAYQMIHISPLAATTSIWEQGREYIFMVLPPADQFLAGFIDIAAENEMQRVAILQEDQLFPRAAGDGAIARALEHDMEVLIHETYDSGTEDFSELIGSLRDFDIQVLGIAASNLDDFIAITRQLKDENVSVKMLGTSGAVNRFYEELGGDAEYVFGLSAWEPGLDNPGIDRFVDDYRSKFEMEPSFHAAGAYGSCKIFAEAVTKAGTLDSDEVRSVLLELETETVFGPFTVDLRGFQTAHGGLQVQWQDGQKVVVWPEELATGEVRFPMPGWDER